MFSVYDHQSIEAPKNIIEGRNEDPNATDTAIKFLSEGNQDLHDFIERNEAAVKIMLAEILNYVMEKIQRKE
jgi:hypothetical protein